MGKPIRCLYPCLRFRARPLSLNASTSYLRFYQAVRSYSATQHGDEQPSGSAHDPSKGNHVAEPRIRIRSGPPESKYDPELYPRIAAQKEAIDYATFAERYKSLKMGETHSDPVVVRAGSKLAFIDLFQENRQIQCLVNYEKISGSGLSPTAFKEFLGTLHRGDVFSISGIPHRTQRAELSVLATELPQLLSRCIRPLPNDVKDKETLIRNRHVDLLLNPRLSDTFLLRAEIINFLRQFLLDDGHIEVQTPILADGAGGAVARPFQTSATEFSDRDLALRIAPELWLKRLILGGFERVFEIGPSFRNEGIDMTHNPEFTTCEFYKTYADLDSLIATTEKMFQCLSRIVSTLLTTTCRSLPRLPSTIDFSPPYPRLDFIPVLETALNLSLPNLTSPTAHADLLEIFNQKNISLPPHPTLPRLLDKLSSIHLEPRSLNTPIWIIHHPSCLSPLSKSFPHPKRPGQMVSARAELFIEGKEFVNCYEEENEPLEQRRKFEEQVILTRQKSNDTDNSTPSEKLEVDESYLQALEWGLPPTGGWGCGVDRLCMLFSRSARIADVLSFGTLRNVVSLKREGKR
ncbi:mitochondrial lysine-tRNA synthetase [Lecanora helva]